MPIPFAKREMDMRTAPVLSPRWAREILILSGIILAMAALGPFGSYASPFGSRLLHWALLLIAGYACFRPVISAARALAERTPLARPAALAVACLFGAVPTSLLSVLLLGGKHWREVTIGNLAATYVQVLIVGTTVTIVQLLARRAPAADTQAEPRQSLEGEGGSEDLQERTTDATTDASSPPEFIRLLPPHLGTEVVCLRNEDHYVRVYTPLGDTLILMRMRDAVTQLEGQGERVHRSWWVATAAVTSVIREGRNVRLKLSDGREVPVARSALADLREKGWLQALPSSA